MTKTVAFTTVSSILVADKEHPNRLLTIGLERENGTQCSVAVRLPVNGGEWKPEYVEAVKHIAPSLFKMFKKYDPELGIELIDSNERLIEELVLQVADGPAAEEAYKMGIAVYRGVWVENTQALNTETDRIPSEEQAKKIRSIIAIRAEDYKTSRYTSFFDFHLPAIAGQKNTQLINILESDYNTTGYLDGLVSAELPGDVGSQFVGIDRHNRRVVVIKGERNQNVVLFERYTMSPGKGAIVVSNSADIYRPFIVGGGGLNEDNFLKAQDLIKNLTRYSASLQKQDEE